MDFLRRRIFDFFAKARRLSAHRSYKRLLAGSFVSGIGDHIGYLAFIAAVSSKTSDVLAIGGISLAEMMPAIIAVPIVQYIIDRYDKRRLLLISDLVRSVSFFVTAFVNEVPLYFVCGFLSAAFTQLFEPSRQALEPQYVPEGEITQANGLRQSMMSLVMILGPSLGAFLVGVFGFQTAFLVNAVSFLFSAVMVWDLEPQHKLQERSTTFKQELAGGFYAVRHNSVLIFLFMLMGLFNLVIGVQFPLIFIFAREALHGGTAETGWLFSSMGIGGIFCGFIMASIPKEHRPFDVAIARGRKNLALIVLLDGVVVLLFTLFDTLLPVMALYTIFGVIGTCFWVSITTAIAEQTSEEYRGRVFSLYQAIRSPMLVISIGLGMPFVHEVGSVRMFQYSGSLEIVLAIAAILYAPKVKERLAIT